MAHDFGRNEAHAPDVFVAILREKPRPRERCVRTTSPSRRDRSAVRLEHGHERVRGRRLARAGQAREPQARSAEAGHAPFHADDDTDDLLS